MAVILRQRRPSRHPPHRTTRWYRLLRRAHLRIRLHGVRVALRGARPRQGAGRVPRLRRDRTSRASSPPSPSTASRRSRRAAAADAAAAPAAAATSSVARGDEEGELLTPAAHAQLQSELAELEGPKRQEVVQAIATARAHGDLSENFEYHAAKNEQGCSRRGSGSAAPAPARDDRRRGGGRGEQRSHRRLARGARARRRRQFEYRGHKRRRRLARLARRPGAAGKAPGDEIEVDAPRGRWRARVVSVGRAS